MVFPSTSTLLAVRHHLHSGTFLFHKVQRAAASYIGYSFSLDYSFFPPSQLILPSESVFCFTPSITLYTGGVLSFWPPTCSLFMTLNDNSYALTYIYSYIPIDSLCACACPPFYVQLGSIKRHLAMLTSELWVHSVFLLCIFLTVDPHIVFLYRSLYGTWGKTTLNICPPQDLWFGRKILDLIKKWVRRLWDCSLKLHSNDWINTSKTERGLSHSEANSISLQENNVRQNQGSLSWLCRAGQSSAEWFTRKPHFVI